MSFPLWYLLAIYGLFLLISGLFFLSNFLHIAKFGLESFKSTLVLIMYLGAFSVIVLFNLQIISQFDWTQMVDIGSAFTTIPGL